jgi:hypothetical protein
MIDFRKIVMNYAQQNQYNVNGFGEIFWHLFIFIWLLFMDYTEDSFVEKLT